MSIKAYIAGAGIILVILGVWQYTRQAEKLGQVQQANATLKKAVEDGIKERNKLKLIAELNSETVAKVSKEKMVLNSYALKLANDLGILKHENNNVKKWSITLIPDPIVVRLLGFSGNDSNDRLHYPAEIPINADGRAAIEVQNENLYQYSNELKAALRSCNADKAGLREWYGNAGVILR